MNHTELLNHLISKYKLKSYLEIGVQNPANNFDKIKCGYKTGVDPNVKGRFQIFPFSSDLFFSQQTKTFDLIFIDGLHHAGQVERDFNNSLKCLNDNGFIVIHDCLPEKEETTHIPRDSKVWHGDVYKFAMRICEYDQIDFVTLNSDNGCCIVWQNFFKTVYATKFTLTGINWETYKHFRREYMHIIEPSELDKYLPKVKHGTPV